jgi:hypothetical protein
MPFSSIIRNSKNFDEFYNRVVEVEKRIRLERKGTTYPINLVIFNRRQQRVSACYRHGDFNRLPNHEKTEILTFIAKAKNSITRDPDKSEVFEIIREKQNNESSIILEVRKISNGGLDFTMEYHDWVQ